MILGEFSSYFQSPMGTRAADIPPPTSSRKWRRFSGIPYNPPFVGNKKMKSSRSELEDFLQRAAAPLRTGVLFFNYPDSILNCVSSWNLNITSHRWVCFSEVNFLWPLKRMSWCLSWTDMLYVWNNFDLWDAFVSRLTKIFLREKIDLPSSIAFCSS